MSKESLTISLEDYIVDTADEFANAIEFRIEHDSLDAVETRLNQHGWFKKRTCENLYLYGGAALFWCSDCDFKSIWPISDGESSKTNYCPNCGAKVVGD